MKFGNTPSAVDTLQDEISKRGNQIVNGIEDGIDSAHDAAQSALSSASSKLDNFQNGVKPTVERFASRGAEMAQSGLDATRQAGHRAKVAASRYASACENYVTEQPMKSVAIAAAAGATLAALLLLARSRSSHRNQRNQFNGR
jgi:ElaB/YqjD/DUF883 family membrane-anchored ribosome-binding protein